MSYLERRALSLLLRIAYQILVKVQAGPQRGMSEIEIQDFESQVENLEADLG